MPKSSIAIRFAANTSMVGFIIKVMDLGGSPIPVSSFRVEVDGPASLNPEQLVKQANITTGWDAAAAVRCYRVDPDAGEIRDVNVSLTATYDDLFSEISIVEAVRSYRD